MASTARFEIAIADQQAAEEAQDYDLHVFELPGHPDGTESYACVRPAPDAWLGLSRSVFVAKQDDTQMGVSGMKFLNECFQKRDLHAALVQALEDGLRSDADPAARALAKKLQPEADSDEELSAYGLKLAKSNDRINDRLMDRADPFGKATLIQIFIDMEERWSANPTGSAPASRSGRRKTGRSSTAKRSTAASTSRRSSAKAGRAGSA